MTKTLFTLTTLLVASWHTFAQHVGLTFQEAEQQGISINHLDSTYKSAIHTDTSLAVFKTDEEQEHVTQGYTKLLQDLGNFLSKNNFKWEKPTRVYQRVYFNTDGSIDYYLFNFTGKTANDKPSEEQQKEFERLLNLFIQDYKFPLKAKMKFAQCGPATFMPE